MNKFNRKGFSIIEMMIAVGLLSILGVGVMTISSNIANSQNAVAVLQDITSYETKLKKLMSDEIFCKNNFAGKILPALSTSSTVNEMDVSHLETINAGTIVFDSATNNSEGKAIISSIKLSNQYMFTPTKSVVNLTINFTDKANRTYRRIMPLIFVMGPGNTILTCSSGSVIMEATTLTLACEIISDGQMYYDTNLKKCVSYPTVPFNQFNTVKATCGSGYRVIYCSTANSTYIPATITKTFSKAGPIALSLGEFTGTPDTTTNSCDCDYTTDYLAASPNVQCVANCTQSAAP